MIEHMLNCMSYIINADFTAAFLPQCSVRVSIVRACIEELLQCILYTPTRNNSTVVTTLVQGGTRRAPMANLTMHICVILVIRFPITRVPNIATLTPLYCIRSVNEFQ